MRHHHGGQNARDWRRKVVAAALGQKENVFTYKFGLSIKDGDFDFDAAARTYNIHLAVVSTSGYSVCQK